jgi:prepilin-type N-terminal cleavage/methylation domain-containing protein
MKIKNEKGFTLIELLVVILIIGILIAMFIANYTRMQDRARMSNTKSIMHTCQLAVETYAVDHYGYLPYSGDAQTLMILDPTSTVAAGDLSCYFPGGEPFVDQTTGIPGNPIINPWTANPYAYTGDNSVANIAYSGYADQDLAEVDLGIARDVQDLGGATYSTFVIADGVFDGTIGILAGGDLNTVGSEEPTDYGIFGFGRYNATTGAGQYCYWDLTPDPTDPSVQIINYYVLHN